MDVFCLIFTCLLHLKVNIIVSAEDPFVTARKDVWATWTQNGQYISHGDEVALYNVDHELAITSLGDSKHEFGPTGYFLTISNQKRNESMFVPTLALNHYDHRAIQRKIFTVFKIFHVDGKSGIIQNGDKIYFQFVHATVPQDAFLGGNVTSKSECIYSFNHGNGFTVDIVDQNVIWKELYWDHLLHLQFYHLYF